MFVSEMEQASEPKTGFFSRLKQGLKKTRDSLVGGIEQIVKGGGEIGPALFEELEEVLLCADTGMSATRSFLNDLKKGVKESRLRQKDEVIDHLKELMEKTLEKAQKPVQIPEKGPLVVLVIGVNGSGKTTTIGKLAARWKGDGKKVIIGAADTFRAAAIEQLETWAKRIDVPCIRQKSGADPSAVAYDTVEAAVARGMDIAIVDTAGRLQTNTNLMEELKKIKRVVNKVLPGAPHETLLVLDSTIGQNSISQAKLFHEALGVDGLVLTKLDGTGKGGVIFNITGELNLPVRFIGIGEQADDLQAFAPRSFVEALFSK